MYFIKSTIIKSVFFNYFLKNHNHKNYYNIKLLQYLSENLHIQNVSLHTPCLKSNYIYIKKTLMVSKNMIIIIF
jgi:hypothetical protein